jgi:hypothetical protein
MGCHYGLNELVKEILMNTQSQPLKEFETHGSPIKIDEDKSLDEVFREAQREGLLAE